MRRSQLPVRRSPEAKAEAVVVTKETRELGEGGWLMAIEGASWDVKNTEFDLDKYREVKSNPPHGHPVDNIDTLIAQTEKSLGDSQKILQELETGLRDFKAGKETESLGILQTYLSQHGDRWKRYTGSAAEAPEEEEKGWLKKLRALPGKILEMNRELRANKDLNKDVWKKAGKVSGEVAKQALLTASSIFGVKLAYSATRFGYERWQVSQLESAIADLLKTKREDEADDVLARVTKLNKKIKDAPISEKERQKFRDELDDILKNDKSEELNKEELVKVKSVVGDYAKGKVTKIEVMRDAVNLACTVGGAYAIRGLAYGGLAVLDRYAKLLKEQEKTGEKMNTRDKFLNQKILKDLIVGGAKETIQGLALRGEGNKVQKAVEFTKAAGIVLRTLGIGATTLSALHSEGVNIGGEINRAIENFGKADMTSVKGAIQTLRFGETANRLFHPFGHGVKETVVGKVAVAGAVAPEAMHAGGGIPTPGVAAPEAQIQPGGGAVGTRRRD